VNGLSALPIDFARIYAHIEPAVAAAVAFYDHLRVYEHDRHSEQGARVQAEFYLRRKLPDLDANAIAVILAEALALRAASRDQLKLK
jgi:hypothetical protein